MKTSVPNKPAALNPRDCVPVELRAFLARGRWYGALVRQTRMENITAAGNTEVPAFLAINALGFHAERRFLDGDREREFRVARNDQWQFSASSPLELLGLFAMRSQRGQSWKASDDEINDFLRRYYPDALGEAGGAP